MKMEGVGVGQHPPPDHLPLSATLYSRKVNIRFSVTEIPKCTLMLKDRNVVSGISNQWGGMGGINTHQHSKHLDICFPGLSGNVQETFRNCK